VGEDLVSRITVPVSVQVGALPDMQVEPNQPSAKHQRSAEIQILNIDESEGNDKSKPTKFKLQATK